MTRHPSSRASRVSSQRLGATVELQQASGREPELLRHRGMLEAVCEVEFLFPEERFAGRGVVICGGGERYLPSTYVLVRLLRHLGCRLPIEVWHLGKAEMPVGMKRLLEAYGVVCVDAAEVRQVHPARRLAGWELKCFALLHSSFSEVLLLDADNCPVRNPEFLFDTPEYREHGAVFWPDFTRFARGQAVWVASGIAYRDEPEFESGQIVVDKARCWHALNIAMHLNEHSDWWYRVVHGDKDTFHLAWRKLGQDYAMPNDPVRAMDGVMLQHDFAGRLLFQHRNFGKWKLRGNRHIAGFRYEGECLGFIEELREQWNELPPGVRRYVAEERTPRERVAAARLLEARWRYERVGHGRREMTFLPDGSVGDGAAGCEQFWDVRAVDGRLRLEVFGEDARTFTAWRNGRGGWRGRWERFEGMPVRLTPEANPNSHRAGKAGNHHRRAATLNGGAKANPSTLTIP